MLYVLRIYGLYMDYLEDEANLRDQYAHVLAEETAGGLTTPTRKR